MADPLSVTSGVIAIVTISFQAAKSLHDLVKSYQNVPKYVRELRDELEALNRVLGELEALSKESSDGQEFASLELPLRRCGDSCKEFENALKNCAERGNGKGSRPKVVEWFKIRWMGSDINGFRDRLAGYKSTISIAMIGVNLKSTKATVQAFEQYKEMIRNTSDDLEDHLRDLDGKLEQGAQSSFYGDSSIDGVVLEQERNSAEKCLQICSKVFEYLEDREKLLRSASDFARPHVDTVRIDRVPSQELAQRTLQDCSSRVMSVNEQLAYRIRRLNEELQDARLGAEQEPLTTDNYRAHIHDHLESVRQCLEICEAAAEDADKTRRNIMEDNFAADDSQQILASTVGDLIFARRNRIGVRSLQIIGQYSDETIQKVNGTRPTVAAESTASPEPTGDFSSSRQNLGRTLGHSPNFATLQK